ncbi:hypothetical protein DSM106972_094620 [Dulcicalothrix desertica PCC 7102]|uniref:Uncharacterized protein n=1 Tax=Dulcicalothrix desertica PCC 7102 TaxID=232991 RepID=A0A3S1BZN8_9CYAN|nr:hypothetical protein DSM106972_094620 [Dulcicalothrix desertica PCC 7102]
MDVECDENENQDTWSFELDEEDDELELAPVDLLIEALQTATSWQEISKHSKTTKNTSRKLGTLLHL